MSSQPFKIDVVPPHPAPPALPVRADQQDEVREAGGRHRHHRPGHGQPHRPHARVRRRQAGRGRPRPQATTATATATASPASAARWPRSTRPSTASTSTPRPRSSPPSAPRRGSATSAWPCSAPATRSSSATPPSPSTSTPPPWPGPTWSACRWATTRRSSTASSGVLTELYPTPKLLILNYPHNPTAMTIDAGFWDKAIAMCRRHGVMIISDFAYGEICFDGYQAPSFLAAAGAKEIGVEFTTMSKSYNMAGWRVGFCCGNAEMVKALATIKGYYDYGILRAGADRQHHRHARVRRHAAERRASCTQHAATSSAAAWTSSAGPTRSRGPACSSGRRSTPPTTSRTRGRSTSACG